MRKLRLLFALAATALSSIAASAQNHSTTVTLQRVYSQGSIVANGQLCAIAVDQYGNPISFSEQGWGRAKLPTGYKRRRDADLLPFHWPETVSDATHRLECSDGHILHLIESGALVAYKVLPGQSLDHVAHLRALP